MHAARQNTTSPISSTVVMFFISYTWQDVVTKILWKFLLRMIQASSMPMYSRSRTVLARSIYFRVSKWLHWSRVVFEPRYLGFWSFVITRFNIIVSTTHTWFSWTVIRPCCWWVGFPYSCTVQIFLNSGKLCLLFCEIDYFLHYGIV
jgi:hypothetical protein